jgi:pimeloyl-ACP methyl ester carboxylesterase
MSRIQEHHGEIDGQPVFWRSATGPSPAVVYLHGVPTNSDDWVPFLQRCGGIAPDLPGFGRSGKSGGNDYTIEGYADFLERFFDHVGIGRVRLLVHDWGAVGLAFAQRHPERVERLVIMNAVTFLPGYKWHRIARIWRTRLVGELFMGATTRFGFRQSSREANATPGPMPDEFLDTVLDHFDEGTQRAILRLYRSAPPDVLEAAGARLGELKCPALVVWGDQDPYIAPHFADAYAAALGGDAKVLHLSDAGHWPWLDRPDLVERICSFLAE